MKFIPNSTEFCVARIGILTEFERIPNIKFETPLALVYTKGGSIPHLTKDAFKLITSKPQMLSTSLPSTYLMFDSVKNTDNSFAEFVGMKEHINFLTLQDPAYATPFRCFRGFDSIPVWTKCGKHELTPNKYMDIIEAFKPDMYVALCDGGTNKNSSQKRVFKAVKRSEKFFEDCLAKHCSSETLKSSQVLGAVEGGYDKRARKLSINYLKDKPVMGYVIDGLHSNGPNVKNISTEEIKEIVEYTINLLPVEKLKVSMGCWNPLTVLDLVELGVDIFDTTYAYQITENLEALTFLCNHSNCNVGHVISFTEERYADDFSPICSHCKCFTCKNHNKAYLYHLCNTKEMLFSVLLTIHNVHQYFEFFEAIRENIKRGSGIFVSPTSALERSGSVGFCLIVWITCGLLSLLGALAFAELSTVVPRSGAEYAYFIEAFSPLHQYAGEIPAFICSWVYVMLLRPAEVAVVMLTFAEYSVQPFSEYLSDLPEQSMFKLKKIIAILALGLITYINLTSVKLYVKVQNIFTVCKVVACIFVIAGGIWWLCTGHTELLEKPFHGTTVSPGNVALAFYSGLWAYDGWTSATVVTEEIQKPEVNILRSIIIAVPLITVLYVSMNLMYMAALTMPEMVKAPAVAVLWAEKVLPSWLGFVIPLGVALSTFGCSLSIQFGVSRLCYVAGTEGHVPRVFSFVHIEKMTPAAAVAFQGLLTLFCLLLGDIIALIEFASFLTWVFYGLAMLSLIIMRRTKPDAPRPYAVPIAIPWLVLGVSIFLAVTPIVHEPTPKYLFALLFILCGIGIYHTYVYKKVRSTLATKITYLIQVLCLVVAPDKQD